MEKTALVIIDNGKLYSSHRHWVACSCASREEAVKLVKIISEWFKLAVLAFEDDQMGQFLAQNKPPVWKSNNEEIDEDIFFPCDYSASVLEVPTWAEGLK